MPGRGNEAWVAAVHCRSRPLGRVASLGQDGRSGRRRPVQVRRLDRASLRSICVCRKPAFRRPLPCSRAPSGFSAPTPRLHAASRPSLLRWRPEWLHTTRTWASYASSTPQDRPHETIASWASWSTDPHASVAATSEMLNQFDVAVVQHEYGLYGGDRRRRGARDPGRARRPIHRDRAHHPGSPDAAPAVRSERGCRLGGPGRGHDGSGPETPVRRLRRGSRPSWPPSPMEQPSLHIESCPSTWADPSS